METHPYLEQTECSAEDEKGFELIPIYGKTVFTEKLIKARSIHDLSRNKNICTFDEKGRCLHPCDLKSCKVEPRSRR